MKTCLFAFIATFLLCMPQASQAQDVVFQTSLRNQYIGVNGGRFWDEDVLQSSIDFTKGNVTFTIWHSTGVESSGKGLWSDFDDEVDVFTTWSSTKGKYSLSAGVGYFKLVRSVSDLDGDIITIFGSLGRTIQLSEKSLVAPFVRVEGYMPSTGETPDSGQLVKVGVAGSRFLGIAVLGAGVNVLHDTGAFGFDRGQHFQVNGIMSLPVTEKVSLNLDTFLSTPLSSLDDGRKTFVQAGVGMVVSI